MVAPCALIAFAKGLVIAFAEQLLRGSFGGSGVFQSFDQRGTCDVEIIRLAEHHVIADHGGLVTGQGAFELRHHFAREGPLADLGNTFVVDGGEGDRPAGFPGGMPIHPQVGNAELEASEGMRPVEQHHRKDDQQTEQKRRAEPAAGRFENWIWPRAYRSRATWVVRYFRSVGEVLAGITRSPPA